MIINWFKKLFKKKKYRTPQVKNEITELFKEIKHDVFLIHKFIRNDNKNLSKYEKRILRSVNDDKEINIVFLKKLEKYLQDYLCVVYKFLNKMAVNNETLHGSLSKHYSKLKNKLTKNSVNKVANNLSKNTNVIINKCKNIKLSDQKIFKLSDKSYEGIKDTLIRKLIKYKVMSDKLLQHYRFYVPEGTEKNLKENVKNIKNVHPLYKYVKQIEEHLNELQDSLVKYVSDTKSCNKKLLLRMFDNKDGTCYANATFFAMFYNMPESFTNQFAFKTKSPKKLKGSKTSVRSKYIIIPKIINPAKEYYDKYISDKKQLNKVYQNYINKYNKIIHKLLKKNMKKKYETYQFLIKQLEIYRSIIIDIKRVYNVKDFKEYINLINKNKDDFMNNLNYNYIINPNERDRKKFNKLIQQIKDITQTGTDTRFAIPFNEQPFYQKFYGVNAYNGYWDKKLYLLLCNFYNISKKIYYKLPENKLNMIPRIYKKHEREENIINNIEYRNYYYLKFWNIPFTNTHFFNHILIFNNIKYVKNIIGDVIIVYSDDIKEIKKHYKKIKNGIKINNKKFILRSIIRSFNYDFVYNNHGGHADAISKCNDRWIYYDGNNKNMRLFNKSLYEFLTEKHNWSFTMFFVKE